MEEAEKENRCVTSKQGGRRKKALQNVSNNTGLSLQEELEAVRLRLDKLNIEKQKTEKLLEERDALLKEKEAELQRKGKAQGKLQIELKKLQKLKEFRPSLSFSLGQSLRMAELAKEEAKKENDSNQQREPPPPYILWCCDQWNQVKSDNPTAVFKDIGSILASKWKGLSAEQKKPYEEKYQAEKEAYLKVVGKRRCETEGLKLLQEEQKQRNALEVLEHYLQYKKDAEQEKKSKRLIEPGNREILQSQSIQSWHFWHSLRNVVQLCGERDPSKSKHPIMAFLAFSKECHAALWGEKHNVL